MHRCGPPAVHHPERRPYSCIPKRSGGGTRHTSTTPQSARGVLHSCHLSDESLMVKSSCEDADSKKYLIETLSCGCRPVISFGGFTYVALLQEARKIIRMWTFVSMLNVNGAEVCASKF